MSDLRDRKRSAARYEHRIWDAHESVNERLSAWADEEHIEDVDDCYLLVGGPRCNVKIRGRKLKVKRLLGFRSGFERWLVDRHRRAGNAPTSVDALLSELSQQAPVEGVELAAFPRRLNARRPGWVDRAVRVKKHRTRYRLGAMRAETTDLWLVGRKGRLRTVAIDGPDLDQLVDLRRRLGIADVPNVAVHIALRDLFSR